MMGFSQNLFGNKVSLSGLRMGSSNGQNLIKGLAGGLKINGSSPNEVSNSSNAVALPKKSEAHGLVVVNQAKATVHDKFAAEIAFRLQRTPKVDAAAATMLADSLTATANEISINFGQEKSNEFMSNILRATDGQINEQTLTGAVSDFFRQIASATQNEPALFGKLETMGKFLNKGLEFSTDDDGLDQMSKAGQMPGLSYSLNKYFDSGDIRGFNSNFERVQMNIGSAGNASFDGGFFTINVGRNVKATDITVSNETVDQVVAFLKNEIKNDDAANYLKNASTDDFLAAVATSMAIVAQENGQEAAHSFMSYLNQNVAGLIQAPNGLQLEGWHLSRDYANPEAPIPGSPPTKLWITNGDDDDAWIKKKHQGFVTNWHDSNGVISEFSLDLNELYSSYSRSKPTTVAAAGNADMNSASGNLVNTTV